MAEPSQPGQEEAQREQRAAQDRYESLSVQALLAELGVDAASGLSVEAAAERLAKDGLNELSKTSRPGLLRLFVAQLANLIILLLIASAIASFAVNSVTSGVAILIIVVVNAGIAAVTENSAGNALEALSQMSQAEALALRSGTEAVVPSSGVVRGDVVLLRVGDVVPADMRLLEAHDLKVNEMPLTGEADDVAKSARPRNGERTTLTPEDMVFSGCSVTNGSGRGVVVATGMNTRVGRIAALLSSSGSEKKRCGGFLQDSASDMTPLQAALHRLGVHIGALAIAVCVAVFGVGLALGTKDPNDPEMPSALYMVLVAITLTVAAIPEGIPLCVTISLSSGSSAMVSRNVLVRRLAAVETLGCASVICSDKTGTLTEGKMRAVKLWASGTEFDVSGAGFDPTSGSVTRSAGRGAGAPEGRPEAALRSALLAGLLCSNARVELEEVDGGAPRWAGKGNSSEVPLVVAAGKLGLEAEAARRQYPRLLEVPFSSSRKMMLTVCSTAGHLELGPSGLPLHAGASSAVAVIKGAPHYVLEACDLWLGPEGKVERLSSSARQDVLRTIDALSSQALRVLAIAARPLESPPFDPEDDSVSADRRMELLCQGLTLLGLVASMDPPREGVREAVAAAHEGHIRVVMITGDYLKTAAAVARDIGILSEADVEAGISEALDCSILRPLGEYLSDSEIDALTQGARVFARAKPEDKLKIVQSLQRQGLVSAMTGDGVNDAPALNAADIGVAMGIQGTEVAKGASDMVLTDDNFCSIVGAVEKGRVIYAGIQRFVAFIMSVHIAEVLQIFACIVGRFPVMRSPLQILYLILVTDLPPSVALGLEPGQPGIMKDRPRPKQQPVLLGWMWQSTAVNSVIITGVIMSVYVWALQHYVGDLNAERIAGDVQEGGDTADQLSKARTVAFIALVWSENIRAYTSRSFDRPVHQNLFANRYMQWAISLAQAALYLAVFLPGLSEVLDLQGLGIGWEGWLAALLATLATLVLSELYKLALRLQLKLHSRRAQGLEGISSELQTKERSGLDHLKGADHV